MGPERRIRVLTVVDYLGDVSGGAENAALTLAMELPRDRFDVHMCATRECTGAPLRKLQAAGIPVHDLGRTARRDLRGHARLLGLLRAVRPDVLHAHKYSANVPAAVFGRMARVPVVIAHEHSWDYEGDLQRKVLDGVVGRLADAFIAVSTRDAERMERLEHVPREKIEVILNAWSPRPAPDVELDLRARLGIADDAHVAATLTVMRRQKRLDLMVEAFELVVAQDPTAHLVIGGDGEERPVVELAIQRRGLQDHVHLLGYVQQTEAVWRAADLLLLSSDFEGTPLVVAEAMAAGVPVVATDVGGLPDLTDEDSAILVPRRDARRLADAVLELLGDDERRARMGAAARAQAATLTAAAQADRVAALYERLLAAKR